MAARKGLQNLRLSKTTEPQNGRFMQTFAKLQTANLTELDVDQADADANSKVKLSQIKRKSDNIDVSLQA